MKAKLDFSKKPYNRCLTCPHLSVRCDGARTSAMELMRWCEFMRDMKDLKGLTNAEVAKKADVSIKRIEQLMAMKCDQDIMRETARRIEDAIIGSSNQYPCYLAFEEEAPSNEQKLHEALRDLERALDDNKDYRSALDSIHASYNAEMQLIRSEAQKTIDYLLGEVQRLRSDCEHWRLENERNGRIIDKYLEKIVSK